MSLLEKALKKMEESKKAPGPETKFLPEKTTKTEKKIIESGETLVKMSIERLRTIYELSTNKSAPHKSEWDKEKLVREIVKSLQENK